MHETVEALETLSVIFLKNFMQKTTIKRSGVLFQAVSRRPCFFSVHAPAQLRPFLLFQANPIFRSL